MLSSIFFGSISNNFFKARCLIFKKLSLYLPGNSQFHTSFSCVHFNSLKAFSTIITRS